MNKLDIKVKKIKQRKRIGLMTHVVVGYPTIKDTITIVKLMAELGADIVELQIPFSDPLADGPTIMRASEEPLKNGTKVKDAFLVMKQLSNELQIPILFMAYYNTVFTYGVEKFCQDAEAAGASGLIVPDMPLDEEDEEHFYASAQKNNLHTIHVISPVSTEERLKKNAQSATGFVYCTARQGITGAKDQLDPEVGAYLKIVKQYFSIPLAVGFGISNKKQIGMLEQYVDIAVIGSAIIDIINTSNSTDIEKSLKRFFSELIT